MDDEKLQVMECVVQKDFKNLQGRSVCMDCVIRDTRGRRYDVEKRKTDSVYENTTESQKNL